MILTLLGQLADGHLLHARCWRNLVVKPKVLGRREEARPLRLLQLGAYHTAAAALLPGSL